MDRWTGPSSSPVESVGVDPSRGGDETIIAVRRGWVFDPLIAVPAHACRGGDIAKRALDVAGDVAPIHVDAVGLGSSTLDHLEAFIGSRARGLQRCRCV